LRDARKKVEELYYDKSDPEHLIKRENERIGLMHALEIDFSPSIYIKSFQKKA
jgi:hypothetical protein